MKIAGRHLVVTPALKAHVEKRLERLARYDVELSHLEVILSVSKLQHMAEVICTVQGRRIQAKASTPEMYATIDQLVTRLAVQIRKYKERQADHKVSVKKLARKAARLTTPQEEAAPELEIVRLARVVLTLEEAKRRLDPLPGSLLVFTLRGSGKLQILQRIGRDRMVLLNPS
ncbi:MAG: Ribosome hibernation promoting factor [Nitrospira sp.]|nr:Ribosome hibernation promoting factor [Nitrospira sp.]